VLEFPFVEAIDPRGELGLLVGGLSWDPAFCGRL
jgi:hypothetical protein